MVVRDQEGECYFCAGIAIGLSMRAITPHKPASDYASLIECHARSSLERPTIALAWPLCFFLGPYL